MLLKKATPGLELPLMATWNEGPTSMMTSAKEEINHQEPFSRGQEGSPTIILQSDFRVTAGRRSPEMEFKKNVPSLS